MNAYKLQNSSQDSQTSGVRFTTADLSDSLRPSTSQPSPLPVRGNAARRKAFHQKDNSQSNTSATTTTTTIPAKHSRTSASQTAPTPSPFLEPQEPAGARASRKKTETAIRASKENIFNSTTDDNSNNQYITQEWPSQSPSKRTRAALAAASQHQQQLEAIEEQSPIVSELTETQESTENLGGTAGSSETTTQASSARNRVARTSARSMEANQRMTTPEPTTFSQLVSGQRIPSVSQSTEEQRSFIGLDPELLIDQEPYQIDPLDDLPSFSFTTPTAPADGTLSSPTVNGLSNTEALPVKRSPSQRQDSPLLSPKKEIVEVVLTTSPQRNYKRRAEHFIIEVPPMLNKLRSTTEARTGGYERFERHPRVNTRQRILRKVKKVEGSKDGPSKNTRSRGHVYKENKSPSRRAGLRSSRMSRPHVSLTDVLSESEEEEMHSGDEHEKRDSRATIRELFRIGRKPKRLRMTTPSPDIEDYNHPQDLNNVGKRSEFDDVVVKPEPDIGTTSISSISNNISEGVPPKKKRWRDVPHTPERRAPSPGDPTPETPTSPILPSTPKKSMSVAAAAVTATKATLPTIPTTSSIHSVPQPAVTSVVAENKTTVKTTAEVKSTSPQAAMQNNGRQTTVKQREDIPNGAVSVSNEVMDQVQPDTEESSLENDPWDLKRLRGLWIKHKIRWPLLDENTAGDGEREPFKVEPYSANFVFGTALPLPKGAPTT